MAANAGETSDYHGGDRNADNAYSIAVTARSFSNCLKVDIS
jgi:hypothetical protein